MLRAAFAMASDALQRQRGHLLTFAPVFYGLGIAAFFWVKQEPGVASLAAALAGAAACALMSVGLRHTLGPVFAALAVMALGFVMAAARSHHVAGPVLEFRYYGTIEGRVVAIDRSASDKIRLTLDRVHLDRMEVGEIPRRVRVALHGQDGLPTPQPGAHVLMTGHLSAPPAPSEPHGFNFERHAWFLGLGAVGYTRNAALSFAPPEPGPALAIFRLRMGLSSALQTWMPGEVGAIAAAVTTGDRSGMSQEVLEDLRHSNLAHLLAISGLHMGLLTGFVFALVRFFLALHPGVALHWPTRKIAAGAALLAGAGYLALSGGAVATERAYIMAAVVFGAVFLDRRALTLRAVAVAAMIVLTLQPEALLGPGFQMSFAATTALIVTFRWLSDRDTFGLPRLLRPAFAVFVSSLVAGLATAPFAAAHFNIVSHYGLVANLLSVPVMGSVVMPAAVFAAILSPFGLAAPALWAMETGLNWILGVAAWVSALEGAVGRVASPEPHVLPIMALGALAAVLWRGRARVLGGGAVIIGLLLWSGSTRPDMLIAPTGGLVGVMAGETRMLSRARGDGFTARSWLENDGDFADQAEAAGRLSSRPVVVADQAFVPLTGKAARLATCRGPAILVLNQEPEAALNCVAITPATLAETGAIALSVEGDKLTRLYTRDVVGRRLWNDASVRRRWGVQ